MEEFQKELREYRVQLECNSDFAAENEKARIAARFSVHRGLKMMFQRTRRAFPFIYDVFLARWSDAF